MRIHQVALTPENAADRVKRRSVIRLAAGKFAPDARKERFRHAVHAIFRKLAHQGCDKRRIAIGRKVQKAFQVA